MTLTLRLSALIVFNFRLALLTTKDYLKSNNDLDIIEEQLGPARVCFTTATEQLKMLSIPLGFMRQLLFPS